MEKTPSSIRIGTRYRANRVADNYDVVIVGSGISGLAAAACLSKMGKKVCVLEQHYTAGGMTHVYKRNGYEWDVGVHYIGDMQTPDALGRKIFDYISDSNLHWTAMDKCFDRIFLGKKSYDLKASKDKNDSTYRDQLVSLFPNETKVIDEYLSAVAKARIGVKFYTIKKLLPSWTSFIFNLLIRKKATLNFYKTAREVLESFTDNQELISVLTAQWGDYGLPPSEASFVIHSMVSHHYTQGGFYPVGGSSEIAKTIIPVIKKSGGDVFTYANVNEIVIEKNQVQGVRLNNGDCISAKTVISSVGVFNTFNDLVKTHSPQHLYYLNKLNKVERSNASVCLYIGLQHSAEELALPKTNFWIYPSQNYEHHINDFLENHDADFPLAYISFPSAKDPSFQQRYPNRATIEIVAPGPYDWFEKWQDQPWGRRGEDYEALKEKISQRLLEKLYEKLPQLKGKIDYYELSTPLSTDYFCHYKEGEIYGLSHKPERFQQDWLRPKTKIKGLYLTGQDIMSCGVVGAMIAGVLASVKVGRGKGWKLAKKIFSGE